MRDLPVHGSLFHPKWCRPLWCLRGFGRQPHDVVCRTLVACFGTCLLLTTCVLCTSQPVTMWFEQFSSKSERRVPNVYVSKLWRVIDFLVIVRPCGPPSIPPTKFCQLRIRGIQKAHYQPCNVLVDHVPITCWKNLVCPSSSSCSILFANNTVTGVVFDVCLQLSGASWC